MSIFPEAQLNSPIERDTLIACAAAVPEGGAIVEIGTGGGGTTHLLREHSHPSVTVTSLDINQNIHNTKTVLANRGITFVDGTSDVSAANWNTPIDFLFIDGGHRVTDALLDFNSWFRYLKPGAKVAFHDYDEPIAGGVYFMGVRVVADTIFRLGLLSDPRQHVTLMTGVAPSPNDAATVTAADLVATLQIQADVVTQVRDALGARLMNWLVRKDGTKSGSFIATGPSLMLRHPHTEPHPIADRLNQLVFCYMFDNWLKEKWNEAVAIAGRDDISLFQEMMRWIDAERRQPYPDVCSFATIVNRDFYPDSLGNYRLSTVSEVSRFVTLEQVRVNMLSRVSNPIFDDILRGYS